MATKAKKRAYNKKAPIIKEVKGIKKRKYTKRSATWNNKGKDNHHVEDIFKLHDGIPMVIKRTTDDEINQLRIMLRNLKPNGNHAITQIRFLHAIKTIANKEFQNYKMHHHINKVKNILSVWRTA